MHTHVGMQRALRSAEPYMYPKFPWQVCPCVSSREVLSTPPSSLRDSKLKTVPGLGHGATHYITRHERLWLAYAWET